MPPSRGSPSRLIQSITRLTPSSTRLANLSIRLYSTRYSASPLYRSSQSWRKQDARITLPISYTFRRNQSTTTSSPHIPSVASTSPPVDSNDYLIQNLGEIASAPDYSAITEQVGFMKELGLNYKWYDPTNYVEWILEHIYLYTGLPWWASIMMTTALFRTLVFPFALQQTHEMAKMMAFKPIMDDLKKKQEEARESGDAAAMSQSYQELRQAMGSAGIKPMRMYIPLLIQAPLGFGAFRLSRQAAQLPIPSWEFGGFGWITDLTVADPYYILPVSMALTLHIMARIGGESGAAMTSNIIRPLMYYVMPGMFFLFTFWQPAALQLTFLVTTIFGVVQGRLFQNARFRQWAGLHPLIKPQAPLTPEQRRRRQLAAMESKLNMAQMSYEAPSQATTKKKGMLSGVSSYFEEVRKRTDQMVRDRAGQRGNPGSRPKGFVNRAEAYEGRRRKELAAEKEYKRKGSY